MLWDFLSRSVSSSGRGERVAVATDELRVTYVELLGRAWLLAARLRESGVGPGHVVLAYLGNVPAFLVTLLATARCGAAFVPLDASMTDAELDGVLSLVRTDLVVCEAADAPRCERFSKNLICVDAAGDVEEVRITRTPAASLDPGIGCVQLSSGTTSASKGVLLSHEAFVRRSHDLVRALGLGDDDRTLCSLPLSHTHGAECLALPTLLAGGTLHLRSPKLAFPLYVLEEIECLGITFFSSIPQFYDFAVKLGAGKCPDLRHLRLPFCGSAALARTTAEAFFDRYGVHIKQGYGLAELSVICINMHDGPRVVYDSVGRPIDGIDWRLVGGECPSEGELVVRSSGMFAGYVNDEQATRERLRDGWLHTGDLVTVDEEGLFRIVGRKEDFIKVNGFKVYATEVEAAIIALDWIEECAVVSEKDDLGAERIVAHVVPRDRTRPAPAVEKALLDHLRGVVSEHKLPRKCVAARELPKNALGKILKSKLRTSTHREESA